MANQYGASVVIDRPPEEVFDFLAAGVNDPKFSARVLEIAKTTDGPPGVGTVFASTVKDAGMKSQREFEYTEFERPAKLRWRENSTNAVMVSEGGYDLEPANGGTKLSFYNVFEGSGFGKLLVGFALRGARKDADGFAKRIKQAVEAS
jgi:uncharacterized protein YndB with AHSA1/START domain